MVKSLLFCLINLYSLSAPGQPNSATIRLNGFKQNDGYIIFRNSQDIEGSLSPIGLTGLKERKIKIPSPVLFYKADKTCLPIFLMPDDILTIHKKGTKFEYLFEKNVIRTSEQKLLLQIYQKYGPFYGKYSVENTYSKKDKARFLHDLYLKRNSLIDSFKTKVRISAFFEQYLRDYFFYSYASLYMKDMFIRKGKANEIFDSIKTRFSAINWSADSSSLLIVDPYRQFLNVVTYVLKSDDAHSPILEKLRKQGIEVGGLTKDYLVFKEADNALKEGNDSLNLMLRSFYQHCTNEEYVSIIRDQETVAKQIHKTIASDIVMNRNLVSNQLTDIISSHKGKVVVMDFWASWCIPCLREMPYYQKLMSEFKSDSNLVFLFFSLDKQKNDWSRAASDIKFLSGENDFLLLNKDRSPIVQKFQINSIPRTIVLSKSNLVYSQDAPRPSAGKELSKMLQHLLQEK